MMGGYNFTERVRIVLRMARDEARRLHHEYIGTEHILLGLIAEGEGIAIRVMENLKVDPGVVTQKIQETVLAGKMPSGSTPDLPYTSRAKRTLELAMKEARDLNHNYVGTEHILLGLLAEEKGIAAQILGYAGLTLASARTEVRRLLETDEGTTEGSSAGVVAVNVEVKFVDGVVTRGEFHGVQGAIEFLRRQ